MEKGYLHSIETFGSVDGPGVRYVIFLQGCQMRCQFCHNPDSWQLESNLVESAQDVIKKALRYRSYWGKHGGITVSGGEPLLQIDFLIELFQLAKQQGIHTTLDTCGQPFTKEEPFFTKFQELMKYTDLLLVDIKHINEAAHIKLTKWSNTNILEMLQYLSDINKPVWIRHVLVPGINSNDTDLKDLGDFVSTLKNVERFEVLPYHTLGVYKWEQLDIPYELADISQPNDEEVSLANAILRTSEYTKYVDKL